MKLQAQARLDRAAGESIAWRPKLRMEMLAPTDIEKREDLAGVFPWLAWSPKPFDEMMGDALDAVASASSQGHITEAEAEVLFREILAAWVSRQTMDLVSPLFENMSSPMPFPVMERHFLH